MPDSTRPTRRWREAAGATRDVGDHEEAGRLDPMLSVRRWWNAAGRDEYPAARRLLVTADAGGSNGYRTRAWKAELAALAVETGLEITVCHFPPGTQCRCLTY